jgi:hypothetical protein
MAAMQERTSCDTEIDREKGSTEGYEAWRT